jgi:hypothetical protein
VLGVKPWLSRRPVLGAFVEMQQGSRRYLVAGDAKQTDLIPSAPANYSRWSQKMLFAVFLLFNW